MKKALCFLAGFLLMTCFFHKPVSTKNDVERMIAKYFSGHDAEVMKAVADCESTDTHIGSHGRVYRGEKNRHDVGAFQINEDYHAVEAARLGYDIYSLEGNVAYARRLYKAEGTKPWNSSAPCWRPRIKLWFSNR